MLPIGIEPWGSNPTRGSTLCGSFTLSAGDRRGDGRYVPRLPDQAVELTSRGRSGQSWNVVQGIGAGIGELASRQTTTKSHVVCRPLIIAMKLIISCNPVGCNPSGCSATKERKLEILKIAKKYGILILEGESITTGIRYELMSR